jgi:hypothetical protein
MTTIKNKIKEVEALMPFLVGLTPVERKRLLKIHRGNRLFVSDAMKAGDQMPELLPNFVNAAELKKDFDLNEQLVLLELQLASLLSKIRDTKTVTGNEAMVNALAIYRSSEAGAEQGVEGADVVFERLKERWDSITSEGEGEDEVVDDPEATDTPADAPTA